MPSENRVEHTSIRFCSWHHAVQIAPTGLRSTGMKRSISTPKPSTSPPTFVGGKQDDLSGDYSSDRNSMTYPQFVESLSLLATYAAERLRRFYPDIAGTNICKRSRGALKESGESSSRAHAGVGRSGLSAGGKDPQRVPGVGSSGKETRGLPGDLARSKTVRTLPVVQRQGAKRCVNRAKRQK